LTENAKYVKMLLLNMLSGSQRFYFLFTIVMKVLVSGTDNPNLLIEVLDELELFIDKKIIFDGKKMFVGPPFAAPSAAAVSQQVL
jgi:hypothetical protein